MKLIVNTGGMFSGKTTELMRQAERFARANKKIVVVKPRLDNRYSENEIVSHNQKKIDAINCEKKFILKQQVIDSEVVLIDEIQFFDDAVIEQIKLLINEGKIVVVSGLDLDYLERPFTIVAKLMCLADEINKFHAVCKKCGNDAMFSVRLDKEDNKNISLGSDDKYIPLCRKCNLINNKI